MSRRKHEARGSDTALVKALVAWRKAKVGRGDLPWSKAAAQLVATRRARSRQEPKLARIAGNVEAIDTCLLLRARITAKIERRVVKKLGQPHRKAHAQRRMRVRGAGKNEITRMRAR